MKIRIPLVLWANLLLQYTLMKLTSHALYPLMFFETAENTRIDVKTLFKQYLKPENQQLITEFKGRLDVIKARRDFDTPKLSFFRRFEAYRSLVPNRRTLYKQLQYEKDHYPWYHLGTNASKAYHFIVEDFLVGQTLRSMLTANDKDSLLREKKLLRSTVFSDELDFMFVALCISVLTFKRVGVNRIIQGLRSRFFS